MTSIETYYLIDFENVNVDGLTGYNSLGELDHIHLFYTDNAKRISLDILNETPCEFQCHKVPVRKQSLDMHLVSYLGYLLGVNQNNRCNYVIISKDTDYDNIIAFWKELNSSSIIRRTKIANLQKQPKSSSTVKSTTTKIQPLQEKRSIKCELNTEIQRAISQAGYDKSAANKVASIVVSNYGKEKFMNNIHNELRSEYTNYSELYKIVKPIISKYSSIQTNKNTSAISNLNKEIQKILSNANLDNNIVNYVASLVCKHHNEKNAKQTIYRSIISKYGQKQGLNIYNHIKKRII